MKIVKKETYIVPHTLDGKKFADEFCERLKKWDVLKSRKEDTMNIILKTEYIYEIEVEK